MKIRKKRTLTVDKFYSVEEIKELYYNKEINLASYNEAIDFIKNCLTTKEIIEGHHRFLYRGESLYYIYQNKKILSYQPFFYFEDENNNLKVMTPAKYSNEIDIRIYDNNIFENYKFMVLI